MNCGDGSVTIGGTVSRKRFEARNQQGTAATRSLHLLCAPATPELNRPYQRARLPKDSPLNKRFALELLVIQHELDRDQWSIAGNVARALGATVED